jgi:hypothetical protein
MARGKGGEGMMTSKDNLGIVLRATMVAKAALDFADDKTDDLLIRVRMSHLLSVVEDLRDKVNSLIGGQA